MNDKLIRHIRRKLEDKNEIFDHFDVPTDRQIKYLMISTIEIVNAECRKCFFCKNYRRSIFRSNCRIKPELSDECFHFNLDPSKVLKKKYWKILATTTECTWDEHLLDKYLSQTTIKNIIYESIRLSEPLTDIGEINCTLEAQL